MRNKLQEKILQTAYNLFLEQGYNETTIRQIAEKAGVERGHLYYYYSKKEDMLFGWYNQFLTEIYDKVVEQCSEEKDGIVLIILCDQVYYKTIFEDERLIKLFATILGNRALTKLKIDSTYKVYQQFMDERKVDYDAREMYIGTCIMIGAEVELFLHMLENDMDMEYQEFVDIVVNIHLGIFKLSDEKKDKILKKTKQYLKLFSREMLIKLIKKANTVQM